MTQAIGDYWGHTGHDRYFKGYIGEVMVFNRALTDSDRLRINAYLSEKWLGAHPVSATNAAIGPIDVDSGATLALYGDGVTIGNLTGTGEVAVESGVASVTNYTGFTGTLTGNGVLALADPAGGLPGFEMDSIGVALRNDTASDLEFAITGSDTNFFTGALQDGESAFSLTLSSSGKTILRGLTSTYTGNTTIDAGVASIGGIVLTKFVRFYPQQLRSYGPHRNSGYQLSEFEILLNGQQIPYPIGTLATCAGGGPGEHQAPDKAIDGAINTKFYTSTYPLQPLVLELPEPVLLDGYRWYTANDATGRDPVSWTVDVSSDGANWTTVDIRDYSGNEAAVTEARNALVDEWVINSGGDMNVLSDLSATTLADPAELLVVASETVGSLSGDGDITLSGGAAFGINAFTNATFTGDITGKGSVVKTGSETQTLSGALSVTGQIVVAEGVLDLDGVNLIGITNIVIESGGELTGSATVDGDLSVAFGGGTYSASLAVGGTLAVSGTVKLGLEVDATSRINHLLFSYASADQATKDALAAATPPPDLPGTGYSFNVRVTDTYARVVAGATGTVTIVR